MTGLERFLYKTLLTNAPKKKKKRSDLGHGRDTNAQKSARITANYNTYNILASNQ